MTKLRSATALLALASASVAGAAAGPGNAAAGREKATTVCAACHGSDGNKALDPSYPRLGGQYADYLDKALRDYRAGKRKNPVMMAQAQTLTDKEIADLSAYFAAQKAEIHDLSK